MSTVVETDPDAPFQLRSLLSTAGTASNGEKLVQTLHYHYSPELRAVMLKKPNTALADTLDVAQVAKIIGVDADDPDLELAVNVHGGETRRSDAWVTFAHHDARGDLWKGAFPYADLEKGSKDRLITQQASLAQSPAARDHALEQKKAGDAQTSADVKALQRQVADLQSRLDEKPEESDPEPVRDYGKAKAVDIVTMLGAAPRETVARVHEYEGAHEKRKTVVEAAEKRIAELDTADENAAEASAAKDARIAELEQQLAAAQAGQSGSGS